MDEERRATTGSGTTDTAGSTGGTGATGASGAGSQGRGTGGEEPNVARELQELGRQLATTARTAWQSERRQELQQEITDSVRVLRDQLTETIETVRTHPRTQDVTQTVTRTVKEGVGKAAETTRAGDIVDDARTAFASGLRELTEQLRRLTERLERSGGDASGGTSDMSGTGTSVGSPTVTDMGHAVQAAPPAVAPQTASQGTGITPGAPTGGTGLPSAPEGPEGPVGMDDKEKRGEIPTA